MKKLFWFFYRIWERIEEFRERRKGNFPSEVHEVQLHGGDSRRRIAQGTLNVVIYVATIGELNGIRPFLDYFIEQYPALDLTIVCGQKDYIDAVRKLYPNADVGLVSSLGRSVGLFRERTPDVLLIAYGPCLYGHFPIRTKLYLAACCLKFGVPAVVLNAMLFRKEISTRIDGLTDKLFGWIQQEAIKTYYSANPDFSRLLIERGVEREKISNIGDLQFETVFSPPPNALSAEHAAILRAFGDDKIDVIVVGSVQHFDEMRRVIEAWRDLRKENPNLRMILAPRQINQAACMGPLRDYVQTLSEEIAYRSGPLELAIRSDLLIVDVFGELALYYSIAKVCYIGRNHGILEPSRFRKLTIVSDDWDPEYVTYPVYKYLLDNNAVLLAPNGGKIVEIFRQSLSDSPLNEKITNSMREICNRHSNVKERIFLELTEMIDGRKRG